MPPPHLAGATPVDCLARLPVPQTGFCACLARGGWAFWAGSRCGLCTEPCQTGARPRRITGTAPRQLAAAPHRGAPLQALWPARPCQQSGCRRRGGGAVPRSGMSSGAASRFASLPQQGSGAPGFRALRIPYRYGRPTWTALTARKGYKGIRDALEQCHALACPDRRIYYIRKYGTIQNA